MTTPAPPRLSIGLRAQVLSSSSTMSIINRSASIDMLATSAMSVQMTGSGAAEHDDGLCHDHHWARDMAAERRAYPRVADAALVSTPSSAMHDDVHYAS